MAEETKEPCPYCDDGKEPQSMEDFRSLLFNMMMQGGQLRDELPNMDDFSRGCSEYLDGFLARDR